MGHTAVVAAVAAAFAMTLAASPASAAPPQVVQASRNASRLLAVPVDPGTITELSDPGVELTAPVDGRLRDAGVSLVVAGAALTNLAGTGSGEVAAGPGQDLVVFGLSEIPQTASASGAAATSPPVAVAVVSGGQRASIDLSTLDGDGPWYFAVAVAKPVTAATAVDLEVSADGYSQDFSLLHVTRVGPQPEILYRDPDNPDVEVSDDATIPVPVTVGPPVSATYQMQLGAATTTIGWFAPDAAADTPASLDQAVLAVQLQAAQLIDPASSAVVGLHLPSPVPADHVHLVLADGTTVTASHVDAPTTPGPQPDIDLFAGQYYFTVPADISAATLQVEPYSAPGQAGPDFPEAANVSVAGFSLPLQLPLAPAPTTSPAAATPPAVLRFVDRPEPSSGSLGGAGSTGATVVWLVVVGLLVGGAAAWAVSRRRRRAPQPAGLGHGWMTAPPPPPAATPTAAPDPEADVDTEPATEPASTASHAPAATGDTPRPPATRDTPVAPAVLEPPVLAPIPSRAWSPPEGTLYFQILGPLRIDGVSEEAMRSIPVLDLAAFLALHVERPYTAEELRDPLSVGKERALEADTVRRYAGNLRRTVGAAHVPDAGRAGYRLDLADTDWHHFQQVTAAAGDGDAAERAAALIEALSLVRGAPYSELPATGFGWVATELLVSQAEVAVIAAARQLAGLALGAGDWPLAAWSVERGLAVSPLEHALNAAALRAAHASGQPDRLAQTWRDIACRFAAADNEPIPAELTDLHRQLRNPTAQRETPPESARGNGRGAPGARL